MSFCPKYGKQLLDKGAKTGANALKNCSQKVIHKAAEATGEFTRKKIADKILKPSRNVEEIIIAPEQNIRNIKVIKTSIIKMKRYKMSKLLNDSFA